MKKLITPSILAILAIPAVVLAVGSGLKVGENVSAFHPSHVSGPLANSDKCFPCTFQNRPQVQVWVNGDDAKNIGAIAKTLEKATSAHKDKEFKAMIVILADASKVDATKTMVASMAKSLGANSVAMSVLSKSDDAVKAYKFNTSTEVKNTVYAYKNWKVAATMVNLKANKEGVASLESAIAGLTK